ncbi:sodium:proton antiporter [Caulobacter segnis]|uniref:sodium:proton antiporter n=1 Tax=Caulobacter segnis TaxID=88688 RepID=UPI00240EA335|nr:sodium:proton antiporter [Caulobacter segnis]MDG2520702.1 sodium:proton antiporter [Caulobacter segnis]
MTVLYALVGAAIVGCAIFMILSRNLVRMLLGLSLLATGANLLLFIAGRIRTDQAPIIKEGAKVLEDAADPVVQALILTAIVIGFALTIIMGVLVLRAWRTQATVDARKLESAEAMGAARARDGADE